MGAHVPEPPPLDLQSDPELYYDEWVEYLKSRGMIVYEDGSWFWPLEIPNGLFPICVSEPPPHD